KADCRVRSIRSTPRSMAMWYSPWAWVQSRYPTPYSHSARSECLRPMCWRVQSRAASTRPRRYHSMVRCNAGAITLHDSRTSRWFMRCWIMPSNAVADIRYDHARERLSVTFVTGRIYEYVDVPVEVAASFQSAFSKGTFFNTYIRDRYDFREL